MLIYHILIPLSRPPQMSTSPHSQRSKKSFPLLSVVYFDVRPATNKMTRNSPLLGEGYFIQHGSSTLPKTYTLPTVILELFYQRSSSPSPKQNIVVFCETIKAYDVSHDVRRKDTGSWPGTIQTPWPTTDIVNPNPVSVDLRIASVSRIT